MSLPDHTPYLWRYRRGLALGLVSSHSEGSRPGAALPLMIRGAIDSFRRGVDSDGVALFAGLLVALVASSKACSNSGCA